MKKLTLLALLLVPISVFAQGSRYQNTPSMKQRADGALVPVFATVSVCTQPGLATTAASVSGNVATLTMASNPITAGFVSGQGLTVTGFTGGDTFFNGGFVISNVTATQISYALTHANATATSNGAAMQIGNDTLHGCAPTATLYTDSTLTTPCSGTLKDGTVSGATNCSNPLITDSRGNYHFYGACVPYTLQVYGSTIAVSTSAESDVMIPGCVVSPLITVNINGDIWLGSGAGQYSSMSACYAALSAGQACHVPAGWTETLSSSLIFSKNNAGFVFHGSATITMGSNQIVVNDGVHGAFLRGLFPYGTNPSNPGVRFIYTDTGSAFALGTSSSVTNIQALLLENLHIDISGAGNGAIGINGYSLSHPTLTNVAIIGKSGANSQKGFVVNDGNTSSQFSGTILASGLIISGAQICIQLNGNTVESLFQEVQLGNGSIAGGIGIDLEGANTSSNVFNGGYITGTQTGIKVAGSTSLYNSFLMEIDGSTTDVIFGSGTSNNQVSWMNSASGTTNPVVSDSGSNNAVIRRGGHYVTGGNLISSQGTLGALTGNSADQTMYSFTVPANFIPPGKGLRITVGWQHNAGTASTTYKVLVNGSAVNTVATSTGADGTQNEYIVVEYLNNSGVQNSQIVPLRRYLRTAIIANVPLNDLTTAQGTASINFANSNAFAITFNVANTDQVIPRYLIVERIQ